jgi:hypothetical protein
MDETPAPRPKPPLPKRRSWQRLQGESGAYFDLFAAYRDLPKDKRTVERMKLETPIGRAHSLNHLRDVCTDYHWVQRAIAYDDFIQESAERADRTARVDSLRRMRKNHRTHGDALMSKAMGYLRGSVKVESLRDACMLVRLALELENSGHVFDPLEAIVSGDDTEQPTDTTEQRRLSIEIFTTGGASMPADDLRSQLVAFYDQKPPGFVAPMSAPAQNPSPPPEEMPEEMREDE